VKQSFIFEKTFFTFRFFKKSFYLCRNKGGRLPDGRHGLLRLLGEIIDL
jgi:hypothetical protein